MEQLKCGAAMRCVTPPLLRNIPQCMALNLATGVRDDLYTHALAVEQGGKTVILISIDTSGLGARFTKRVRHAIAERIPVDPDAVMVSAIHIHTGGPQLMDVFWGQGEDAEVTELFFRETVEAAVEAYQTRVPVTVRFGEGREDRISFCRNYRMQDGTIVTNPGARRAHEIIAPASEIDYTLSTLRFDDGAGKPIAEIVNFACHPDTIGGSEYSADYPGALRRALKRAYGEGHVVVFLNGCSGNVNHIDGIRRKDPNFRYPKEHYVRMGDLLAEGVLSLHRGAMRDAGEGVAYAIRRFRAPRRQPSEEEVKNAERTLGEHLGSKVDKRLAKELLRLAKHPRKTELVEMQTLRIGNVTIAGFPGEPFADVGLRLREAVEGDLMISELAGNELGYFATGDAYDAGVYEAVLPSAPFTPDVIDRMIEVSTTLAKRCGRI